MRQASRGQQELKPVYQGTLQVPSVAHRIWAMRVRLDRRHQGQGVHGALPLGAKLNGLLVGRAVPEVRGTRITW
jgi:hypothetical protein